MKCNTCGNDRGKGKVDGNEFTCNNCLSAAAKGKATGTTRYYVVKVKGEFVVVTAEYTESAKRFNKVKSDALWPYYNDHALKKYSFSGMPGYGSPQAAVAFLTKQTHDEIERRTRELERLQKDLGALQLLSSKMGPPEDPSCINPTG